MKRNEILMSGWGWVRRGWQRSPVDRSAVARWENEGGVGAPTSREPEVAPTRLSEDALAAKERACVLDNHYDDIMAGESSDGRPPSRRARVVGWRWLGAGAVLFVVGVGVWALMKGVSAGAIVAGVAIGVPLLLIGTFPVWWAGLLHGKEERAARKSAVAYSRWRRWRGKRARWAVGERASR